MKHLTSLTLLFIVVGISLTDPALAQTAGSRGVIEGTVIDASGAVVPGAMVSLTGPVFRTERSGPTGTFRLSDLPPGTYSIAATHPRFARVEQSGIELKQGETATVSLKLSVTLSETVVVSATRNVELSAVEAPATVSVVQSDKIAAQPAGNVGDLLRSVPGLNVTQTSAREINLAARQASPLLSNSQLALIDGRTIYSDFFNLIFWDLMPINFGDIEQIEVIRGPASAMWGANAATGVVNIITKTPRRSPGFNFMLSGGGFGRTDGDLGGIYSANASYAHAPNERWAYRLSAGYLGTDAFSRPSGQIPFSTHPLDPNLTVGGGRYDSTAFANHGTRQPKFDFRLDRDFAGGGQLSYSLGMAGSQGIIHTPIGPFDLKKGAYLAYTRLRYAKGGFYVSGFANLLNGEAPNLIQRDITGDVLRIDFNTDTFDVDAGYSQLVASRHLISYGGNVRRNLFDISLTPFAKNRTEVGGYLQDDISLGKFRLAFSARVDKFGNLKDAFFSPRAAVIYRLGAGHALRFSFNRAFRAPSAIDNHLDITVFGGVIPLGQILPALPPGVPPYFPIPTRTIGNRELRAEVLDAYEWAYTGTFRQRTTAEVSFYINDSDRVISSAASAQNPSLLGYNPYYTSQNPPPGWPLQPAVIDLLAAQGIRFLAVVKTLNLGGLRNRGFELALDHRFNTWLTGFANYSYQDKPWQLDPRSDPRRIPTISISVAPTYRLNAGMMMDRGRYIGTLNVNRSDRAFWTDVLNDQYYGYSNAYTMVNASFGVRWSEGRYTVLLKATNLANHDVQQHIFGDILKRSLVLELRFSY